MICSKIDVDKHSLDPSVRQEIDQILTGDALGFLAELQRAFNGRRLALLQRRIERQTEIENGKLLDFLPETEDIRLADWTVAPIPTDLLDRRVEITGPPERKMVINALNSGANVFMADFEDANSPTWSNNIVGQINLRDAVRRSISYVSPDGRRYSLTAKPAVLFVRPRGWHLVEKHLLIDGTPVSGSLFDFGLFFFHNAKELLARGSGPYFYLPKLQSHLEARLWNDVFLFAQDYLNIPRGSIRATVLIETIWAAFEMDEILYELRQHSAGLNCGRWDYIFSYIKTFQSDPRFVLPDRGQVTMDCPFLKSYVDLLIRTCHRRAIHAMGGMAAQIPIRDNPEANQVALEKVRADKLREVQAGHDGTWVAHPGLVAVARQVFDAHMTTPNQIDVQREDVHVCASDLLAVPTGSITEQGLRLNIDVCIRYLEAWLRGQGCVPIYNLMEDAATAEISRAQVWQWLRHKVRLESGEPVTFSLIHEIVASQLRHFRDTIGEEQYSRRRFTLAAEIFERMIQKSRLDDFLTLEAYEYL
jgi:malate synthase